LRPTFPSQIPLVVRALLSLGVCCSVDKSVKGGLNRGLDKGFDLKDLEKASPTLSKRPYLNGGDGIRYLYLYHSSSSGRHLLGLFSPDQDAAVFSIDGARARQPITHLPAFYAERVGKLPPNHGRHGVFGYERRLDFQVSYHGNEAAGFKALNRALATFASQRGQPTMLVVFSSQGQQFFEQRAPAVLDFPVVMLPSSPEAGSPLMWLGHTSRRMVVAYLAASDTLKHHMEVARHHDVPVGNLSTDSPLFLADIDFARRLQSHDVVLWWSLGSRPDLGGVEDDANTPQAIDDLASPEFTNPGCYSNVTFRVSVTDLAINSVLQSALVNEMEGSGSGSMAFDSASHNLDDYSKGTAHASLTLGDAVLSTQTFGILKSMVKAWYLHKARFSDDTTVADMLVDNFWRWISSSSSAMFDPGLHRFLHGLMKKTFIQLLAEFKRLGSTVVHANFNEIVLLTSKPSTANTVAYAAYLLTAANSHELFRHLDFKIVNFWELLVWMDPQNYGGVPVLPENGQFSSLDLIPS
jgi:DNA polymerase epsilon subunit 1